MLIPLIVTETTDTPASGGGLDLSSILDVASLLVAVIVGIGSALVTGWVQTRRDRTQQRQEAIRCLVNYERALGDASGSLEAQEIGLQGPSFPENLDDLRMEAYPHFRFLRDTGDEDDKKTYWLLNDPASGHHPTLVEASNAYGESHSAATRVITRLTEGRNKRSRADSARTTAPEPISD